MRRRKDSLVAIDPGSQYLGYAAFEGKELVDFGVRTIRQGGPDTILEHVTEMLERMLTEKRPPVVVYEQNQFSQATSNYRLLRVIGKIKSVSRVHRIRCIGYNARTIRRIVTGNGNARKIDAARTIVSRFPETKHYLRGRTRTQERYFGNMFDAVAAGVAHLETLGKQQPFQLSDLILRPKIGE